MQVPAPRSVDRRGVGAATLRHDGARAMDAEVAADLTGEALARLAAAAKRHRRSLNNEAIVCLEAGLGHDHLAVEQQLAEIRTLRDSLAQHSFDPAEIDAFKREGRP